MTKPVRLQLSRQAGFSLQALSKAVNGLPAVVVARPAADGNPYVVGSPGIPDNATAVRRHRATLTARLAERPHMLDHLKARNVACWCGLCPRHRGTGLAVGEQCQDCEPCHGDTLLELANP